MLTFSPGLYRLPTGLLQLSSGWCRGCLSEATTCSHYRTRQLVWSPGLVVTTTSRRFLQTALVTSPPACNLQDGSVCVDSGSAYTMKLQAIWLTSAFQSRLHMVVNSCVPRRPEFLWSRTRTSTGRLQWTAYMEQLIGLPAALRSPDLSLCSFKRQLKFYLFPH